MEGYIALSDIEKRLLEKGLSSFSTADKNELITVLAHRDGLTFSEISDEYILNHHKNLKIDILSAKCDKLIINGFEAESNYHYRTNRDDQLNFIAKNVQLLHDDSIKEVNWKTENGGYVLHTREEWLSVYNQAMTHKEKNLYKYNTLKLSVINAETDEDVVAVLWD